MTYITEKQRAESGPTDTELNFIGAQWHLNLLEAGDKAEVFAFARAVLAKWGTGMPIAEPGSDADMVHKLMGSTIAETVRADAAEKSVEDLEAALASWKAMSDMLLDELRDLDAMHKADTAWIAELESQIVARDAVLREARLYLQCKSSFTGMEIVAAIEAILKEKTNG